MIHYIQGDLLKSDCDVIAHGCNCFVTWGAGIARQILRAHPEAFDADFGTIKGDQEKLGTFTSAYSRGRHVFNIYSQFKYGNDRVHVDYDALRSGLSAMRGYLEIIDKNLYTARIGIPMIGCGLAGGEWSRVSRIVEDIFHDVDVFVYVFDDNSLRKAREAGERLQSSLGVKL